MIRSTFYKEWLKIRYYVLGALVFSILFLEVFSGVDILCLCLIKVVTKLKIIEQGKFA